MSDGLRAVHVGPEVSAATGEWILVTLSIGSRSTAAMAVIIEGGDGTSLLAQFDAHDWDRIQAFALRSQSPPSNRAPRIEPSLRVRDVHMPSVFPSTAEGLGAPYLHVLHYKSANSARALEATKVEGEGPDSATFDATLSAHGMVVESARTLDQCEERLRGSSFHVLIVSMTQGTPELALLAKLTDPRPLVVCLAGGAESIDLVRAFEAGADECLTRETSATELAARLTGLVLRKRAQNPGAA